MNWLFGPQTLFDDNATGGAPAPSSAPAAPAAPAAGGDGAPVSPIPDSPPDPTPSHDSFAGMEDNDFDLVELPTDADLTGDEPGKQPTSAPPASPPVQQSATTAPAVPQEAKPPAPPPADNVPATPRSPLEQAIEGFRTNHNELSKWASSNLFALTEEESNGLETNAVATIPLLMGRVYSQALQATVNLMKNFVPQMINEGVVATNARSAKASEALQEFYAANSHLNPQQHGALVDKWARAFRAANPQASRSDAIKFVGNAVSAELGVAAHVNGGPAKRAAPFAPARPGTRAPQASPHHDPYEGMDMEYDQE